MITKKEFDEVLTTVKGIRDYAEKNGMNSAEFKAYQEKAEKALDSFEAKNNEMTKEIALQKKQADETLERAKHLENVISGMSSKDYSEKKEDVHLVMNALARPDGWSNLVSEEKNYKIALDYLGHSKKSNGNAAFSEIPGKEFKQFMNYAQKASADTIRTDIGAYGGYLCPPEWASQLLKQEIEKTPIRQYARTLTVGARQFNQPIRQSIPTASWAGELDDTSKSVPTFRNVEMTVHRLQDTVPISWEHLNNAQFNASQEIMAAMADSFAQAEGKSAISGNGVTQYLGMTQDPNIPIYTTATKTLTFDDLIGASGKMKVGYNPIFAFNRKTSAYLRLLKDDMGRYLWAGVFGDSAAGVGATISGYRYSSEFIDLDDVGTAGNIPVIFADFSRGYLIVDNADMVMIRDEVTQATKGLVNFTTMKWTMGMPVMKEAIELIKIHA